MSRLKDRTQHETNTITNTAQSRIRNRVLDMENVVTKVLKEVAEEQTQEAPSRAAQNRVRKPTLLKVQWLAERLRKAEQIKARIAAGEYHVDSTDIAKAILHLN